MTVDNPYRAAGAFAGKAYIRRGADAELVEQIRDNQYYPYFAAPRQSGKSSLIARTMASLSEPEFRCALVDLSPFVVRSYDEFWRQFLHEVARSANFDPAPIGKGDPRDAFKAWLTAFPGRLVVFIDEIDTLLHVECREQIFSKIRTFFNLRAHDAALQRLTFVLAGAAHSSRFISDPRWSPFNVAIEIALEDLSMAQVSQLASYLATAGAFAGPDLVSRVYELTGGSVFLCQLVFEALWNRAARGKKKLDASDVDAVVASIVAESPRNIHFYNIFRLVTQDARLAMLFRRLVDGEELGEEDRKELQLTGLCRGMNPFRNDVYARVFGAGGPLDLKVAGAKVTIGRKLEAALNKRQQLEDEGKTTSQIEAEIAALKRELREGAQLREGDVLARGRYRLIRQIGQGGFATVWQTRDETAKRDVALKVLHGQFAEDRTRRDRFFRGAWKMSELGHPAIVQVFEPYGEEAGRYYFVMEFMPGGTLHEAVLDKKTDPEAVIKGIVAVGEALAHAHERGLVHRDVKPSNVLLAADGTAKLTDFDLVREQDASGSTRTGPMGSFIYAAPEVLNRPQDADHRADIYGLAMTAVFGLHGAELPLEVVRDADRFIDRLHCGGIMKDVLKKGVAWELERRFRSAAEFTQALATAWADKEVAVVAANERGKAPVGVWTGMFATMPMPDRGPLAPAAAAPAAGAAVAVGAVAAARAAETSRSAASASGSTTEFALDEAPTSAGPVAEADAPTQVTRQASARRETGAAAAVLPAQTQTSRGMFAALGLLATAALVLLALKIGGPGGGEGTSGPFEMGIHGAQTEPAKALETPKKSDKPPVLKDSKKDEPSNPTVAPATSAGEHATSTRPEDDTAGEGETTSASDDPGETETTRANAGGATANAPPNVQDTGSKKPPRPSVAERIDEGCTKVKGGNAEVGVKILLEAREDKPRDVGLLRCLAKGLETLGDYPKAEHYYELLLRTTEPGNLVAILGLARVNEKMTRYDRAEKYYGQALRIDGNNKAAQTFLMRNSGGQARMPPTEGLDLER